MTTPIYERVAVIDIGKTNAKVVVVDARTGAEIALRKTANTVVKAAPYPHYDTDHLWSFMLDTLRDFASEPGYDALSITTHGASAALLDASGELAMPVLDYEHLYPDEVNRAYDAIRPDFNKTFSPRLTGGLNLGAQLHYQRTAFPEDFARTTAILTYPQYWAYRLTGIAANERTSLGCHTDLWLPFEETYSRLVDTLDIRQKLAPLRSAFDALGNIEPAVAIELGLDKTIPVYCGIHDSNASLLPHLVGFGAPCTVVSTGTWVVCFAVGGKPENLDKERDTLVNVDAYGTAVPSGRYMGGREWEIATEDTSKGDRAAEFAAAGDVIDRNLMLLPSLVSGTGPFPHAKARWTAEPASVEERRAAASLYQAMMTVTCLEIIGSRGPIVVEGPFAANEVFLAALHTLTERPVHASLADTGTALGAALLAGIRLDTPLRQVESTLPGLQDYARLWAGAITS
ncbi:FGGY-family carbohydrate kinase [Rhizobium sp. G187]|uniref:FGGY-family carbohydrate kinase n=1 Tax=Rhizobium sp. G187 TaxID=3451352 RepID=UPI003EE4A445